MRRLIRFLKQTNRLARPIDSFKFTDAEILKKVQAVLRSGRCNETGNEKNQPPFAILSSKRLPG